MINRSCWLGVLQRNFRFPRVQRFRSTPSGTRSRSSRTRRSGTQTLQKIRHNPAQSSQRDAAARRANVLGAYRAVSPERFAGRSVLLIDDIVTTGATLSECCRMLRQAGAKHIYCATFASPRKEKER